MKNLIWGALIIGIGLMNGGSIFTGNPGMFDYVFDVLGIVLVVSGIYQMVTGGRNKEG